MNVNEYLSNWAACYKKDLTENILPFWLKNGLDRKHGGVYTCLDRDGSLMDTTKSVWFQGRFGFIVPVMHKKMESFWKVSLLGFMFSLCVETIQLITKVGCFDVDDLILNTLGAMIGCGAFLICNKFRRWKYGEEEV